MTRYRIETVCPANQSSHLGNLPYWLHAANEHEAWTAAHAHWCYPRASTHQGRCCRVQVTEVPDSPRVEGPSWP